MKLASLLLSILLTLPASSATAQPRPLSARDLYNLGIAHYKVGEFQTAIADFKAAYAIEPSDVLLFNLAQAHRQLGDGKRALFFYRAFVRQAPPSPARTDAERMVAELEAIDPPKPPIPPWAPSSPVPPPPPPAQQPEPSIRIATAMPEVHAELHRVLTRRGAIALVATTGVLGTVLVLTGAGLEAHARSNGDSLEGVSAGTQWSGAYQSRYDDGHASSNAATALFVIGGAALATSVISAIVFRRELRGGDARAQVGRLAWAF